MANAGMTSVMADYDDDPILEVSAAELNRRFGEVRRQAVTGPVAVTYHGRKSLILLALDEYQRLQQSGSDADAANDLRRRITMLMDHVSEGYIGIGRDWNIVDCNRTAELFVGRTREELIGRNLYEAFPTSREDIDIVRRAMEYGEVVHVERFSSIHPDRRLAITAFPYLGAEGGAGALFSNISEQTRMVATIKERDTAIAFLLAECKDRLIFMIDSEGRFEHWGTGGQSILGWSADDVIARPLALVLAPGQEERAECGSISGLGFLTRNGGMLSASGMIRPLGTGRAKLFVLSPDAVA